jgi:SAM-dependent methyltransferase
MGINYISAINDSIQANELENKMSEFYRLNEHYYDEIEFGTSSWFDINNLIYQDILRRCINKEICEVGCGKAGILRTKKISQTNYSGCDFSDVLIHSNNKEFPLAQFRTISDPKRIPFEDESFDVVFSVFVIEHVVHPHLFIEELMRITKPNGQIIIHCPDFYGRRGITSQLSGKYPGTGSQKLKQGYLLDTFKSVIIGRILMPIYLLWRLRNADKKPVFLLNNKPSCFFYPFTPDVDAVYVTHKGEIITKFKSLGARTIDLEYNINENALHHNCLYLVFECS